MLRFGEEDFKNWERFYRANFFNSLGGFKSLNLLGTQNKKGVTNLATFFSAIHVGANPPLAAILFRPHTVPRHSLENLRETGYFTLNSMPVSKVEQAHQASAKYEEGQSEFKALGLTEQYESFAKAPYVLESAIKFCLKLREEHLIEANQTILVVGEIVEAIVSEEALSADGHVEHTAVNNLLVNGLETYYTANVQKRFEYARPETKPKVKQ
jgi:flavin reductase (DIM6/NTAB) family NADH-FMN oxidoreductase RutF